MFMKIAQPILFTVTQTEVKKDGLNIRSPSGHQLSDLARRDRLLCECILEQLLRYLMFHY